MPARTRRSIGAGRSVERRVAIFIAFGVCLRLAMAFWLGDRVEPISGAFDQVSYDALARRLAGGFGFTFAEPWYPYTEAGRPTAHWSYLYTIYLAALYWTFGPHPLVARLIQALVSGVGGWLLFRIGARLFGPAAAVMATALAALYAYLIFFDAVLMTQSFYVVALLAAIDRAYAVTERPSIGRWMALGLSLGAGALLRQTLLVFAPVLLFWTVAHCRRDRWRGALASIAALAATILPWTLYNHHVFDDWLLLNSNGGFFLYSSNHPRQGTSFDPTYVAPLPPAVRGLSVPALDRVLYREALSGIAADPVRFMQLSVSRIPHYYWILPSPQSSSLSNAARLCSFALYLPFMVLGLWLSRQRWRACLPLYLYVGFDAVLHLTSWAAPRYRLPSDALLMPFAALAVQTIAERVAGSMKC